MSELADRSGAPSAEELMRVGAMQYEEKFGAAPLQFAATQPYVPVIDKLASLVQSTTLD